MKSTALEHPDYQYCEEALVKANELCQQVNEGVRERENADRLEWIQLHVHADGLPEVRVFLSHFNYALQLRSYARFYAK